MSAWTILVCQGFDPKDLQVFFLTLEKRMVWIIGLNQKFQGSSQLRIYFISMEKYVLVIFCAYIYAFINDLKIK